MNKYNFTVITATGKFVDYITTGTSICEARIAAKQAAYNDGHSVRTLSIGRIV